MTLNLGSYLPKKEKDSGKLLIAGVALLLTFILFTFAAEVSLRIVRVYFQYHSKPRIELIAPPPACKVCHCGKASCHQECGEENMCAMKCEGLCRK